MHFFTSVWCRVEGERITLSCCQSSCNGEVSDPRLTVSPFYSKVTNWSSCDRAGVSNSRPVGQIHGVLRFGPQGCPEKSNGPTRGASASKNGVQEAATASCNPLPVKTELRRATCSPPELRFCWRGTVGWSFAVCRVAPRARSKHPAGWIWPWALSLIPLV